MPQDGSIEWIDRLRGGSAPPELGDVMEWHGLRTPTDDDPDNISVNKGYIDQVMAEFAQALLLVLNEVKAERLILEKVLLQLSMMNDCTISGDVDQEL